MKLAAKIGLGRAHKAGAQKSQLGEVLGPTLTFAEHLLRRSLRICLREDLARRQHEAEEKGDY